MCYTDIFLGKKGLCVKLGFVCVITIYSILNIKNSNATDFFCFFDCIFMMCIRT